MTAESTHPRHRLDELIHAPVRLSIMAALAGADRVEFRFLRDLVEVSDSLLSKHLGLLEAAGYVEVIKGFVGKRPRTWLRLTAGGRAAFDMYAGALRALVAAASPQGPDAPSTRG
jgi:DNA-binding MarR family transcriptional regulator